MPLRPVTLGILGDAEVTGNLVVDTLNAHFSLGAEDTEGYFAPSDRYELHAFIPAGEHVTSQGVHAFWEWAVRCELPYQVLFDETHNERTDDVLANVEDAENDILIVTDLHQATIDRLAKSENPMLLVLSTEGAFDAATAEAAAAALREGIPVHDLSRMLLEITWQHLPDHEPPAEAAVEAESDGQMALVVADAPEVTLTGAEATAVGQALAEAEAFIDTIFGQMVNSAAELRQSLVRGRSLLAPKPPEAPGDAASGEKPKKTRLEIFNETTGRWEPAGRGRPPAGVQKRRVPA